MLNDKDVDILKEVFRWRFLLSRHVKVFCNFGSTRNCDRRLKKLVDEKYLKRTKVYYGVPYIYYLTHKSKKILNLSLKSQNINTNRLIHDIHVLDTVVFFINNFNVDYNTITTEKELHSENGFNIRKHQPDFLFDIDKSICCVEVEITLKSKKILEKNIGENYLNYDYSFWIVKQTDKSLIKILEDAKNTYENIKIIYLDSILKK